MLPSRSRFKSLVYTYDSIGLAAKYVSQRQAQPREVWITFDDGPHPVHTVKILDTLRRHKVQATFFWIGQCAEQHPDIVRRAIDDGHYIGNHSYSHPFLTQLTRDEIRREIMRADEVLASYHQSIKLFRPPHGDHNEMVDQVVAEAGYQTILWNLSTRDWHWLFRSGLWVTLGTLLIRVIATSTVLMHADLAGTANHLDDFLTRIKRLDASFMPPETLLTSWRQGIFL